MNNRQVKLAVLPVAGLGTRLLPLTKSLPKEMLPVGRLPCAEHIVAELYEAGIREILLVNSVGKELTCEHFQRNRRLEDRLAASGKKEHAELLARNSWSQRIHVQSTVQPEQKGLGDAVLCGKEFVNDQPFIIALGDSIIHSTSQPPLMSRMIRHFNDSQADIVVAFQKVPVADVVRYGIAQPGSEKADGVFDLVDVVEKPSKDRAPSQLAIAARYVMTADIFSELENTVPGIGGEIQLTDAISSMIRKGAVAQGVCLNENECRIDIGSLEGYCRAFIEMALADKEVGESVRQLVMEKAELIKKQKKLG